ncbi:peptidase S8/S53 domain-containing protein [Daldinia vernicosa]|uniref:peptidase S8/S53 domain-containing protein n=1 Tax=Daldinia vernicosa TaxID=114800 RepID=UPI002008CA27|nr:peptidase S8/S53 domain-containing protein [Daldinia vernicosa]KAI0853716.1 peptidase S8/S53 domain-containing protein [Daldinia vernicosa]
MLIAILPYLSLATLIAQASSSGIHNEQYRLSADNTHKKCSEDATPVEPLATTTQKPTTREMWFLSQANGVRLDQTGAFAYDESAGAGSLVYVVDTGADLSHPEFDNVRGLAEWLYPGNVHEPGDSTGHGTKMLSKITGKLFGASKRVRPVIVRVPTGVEYEEWVTAVRAVRDDYRTKIANGWDRRKPAIVSMSFAISPANLSQRRINEFETYLNEMVNDGLFPITGSGNFGGRDPGRYVSEYPALFGDPLSTRFVNGLLVVGGVKTDGTQSDSGKIAPFVVVNAPSERICVPNHRWTQPNAVRYTFGTGTSEAAATTAGLAAYLIQVPALQDALQLNNRTATARDKVIALKHYIEDTSFPRGALTPRAIWNSQKFKPFMPDLKEFDCEMDG